MRSFFASLMKELADDAEQRRGHMRWMSNIPSRHFFILNKKERECFTRNTVPAIYATWEGFVVRVCQVMVAAINSCHARVEEIQLCLVVCAFHAEIDLGGARKNSGSQARFVEKFFGKLSQPFQMTEDINPKANISYKVLNDFLTRLCIKPVSQGYHGKLSRLIRVRNGIVHGSNSTSVSPELLDEFVSIVSGLMDEVAENVRLALREETFYRKSAG